jgi:hypothetical protein
MGRCQTTSLDHSCGIAALKLDSVALVTPGMAPMHFIVRAAFLCLLISTFLLEQSSPGKAQDKIDAPQSRERSNPVSQTSAPPPGITFSPIINVSPAKKPNEQSHCIDSKNPTDWIGFVWCRSSEWLDAENVVAAFTVILGIATLFLWFATRALVKEAKTTGERQLRGYMSVTPKVVSTSSKEERFVQIECTVKNHGQTPIHEINFMFDIEFLAHPPPVNFQYPEATRPITDAATLFPQAEMLIWFNFDRTLTAEEFEAMEKNQLRLHLWGKAYYTTVFGQTCHTDFKASVGGGDFIADLRAIRRNHKGPGFNWSWAEGHGFGT